MNNIDILIIIVGIGTLAAFACFVSYTIGFNRGYEEGESIGRDAFDICFHDLANIERNGK